MWNIIIGIGMIIGGATGKLVLIGTDSAAALVVLGVVLLGWGHFSKGAKQGVIWPPRTEGNSLATIKHKRRKTKTN